MRLVQSPAFVLHAFDYRETSRIVRLATREVGVVSVIARGARRAQNSFGPALDLFASGIAHVTLHPTHDLHALTAFDVTRARPELASSLSRFAAASALSEVCMRFAKEEDAGQVHDAATALLDAIGRAARDDVATVTLAGIWRLVAELGFAPSLDACASCHAALPGAGAVTFHHRTGGALCARCAPRIPGGRALPDEARAVLTSWLAGDEGERRAAAGAARAAAVASNGRTIRAHQRLLREFLEEHMGDGRALRAFTSWEERCAEADAGVAAPAGTP